MTKPWPHRSWSWPLRFGVAIGTLAFVMVLGRALVMAPSAEAQADLTFTLIYSFKNSPDGSGPYAGLIRDGAGNFYGTTAYGGLAGYGTVFKLDATGGETVLHSFTFGGADGSKPFAGLVRDAAGNLYGTTSDGGGIGCTIYGCGTVFKLDTSGTETVLHRFTGGADGGNPYTGLVRDPAGNLYGTTYYGGSSNNCYQGCGTVFKLDTTGAETVLHSFTGAPDGNWPSGSLILDATGNFYGTTTWGGASVWGTVFKVDTTGAETVLYSFTGGADGGTPASELILDAAGNLYGTTQYGGAGRCRDGCGTVFKLDTTGTETVLYRFQRNPDGERPVAGLIQDAAGNLYGTTLYGGERRLGTVFKLDPTGKETVLHRFTRADGQNPDAGLVRDSAGNLYGTSYYGGASGAGTVFKLSR